MYQGKYLFAQIIEFVPRYHFQKCVEVYGGNYKVRQLSCWDQFLSLLFGQLTHRESLRDIVACLQAHHKKQYHLGFRTTVFRTTLAKANEQRDWRIYHDFSQVLIHEARRLYANDNDFSIALEGAVYALDATVIDLCLHLFPWAKFRKKKGAVKVHLLLDLRGSIPTVFSITTGKIHEVNMLDTVDFEEAGFYIMDRGYWDYARLFCIETAKAFFVIRAKINMAYTRHTSQKIDTTTGLRSDQIISFTGHYAKEHYPNKLRRIRFFDEITRKYYTFLTNNMHIDGLTIAQLYKHRWKIELFFKWLKQHVRIKVFWGRTENAVKTQISVAISAYVLIAIVKKKLNLSQDLYQILQVLSTSFFDRSPILTLFSPNSPLIEERSSPEVASLWDS
jgi:hypothetical protein